MQVKRVSEPFMRRVRSVAADRGITVRELVLSAIAEKLAREGVDVPDYEP